METKYLSLNFDSPFNEDYDFNKLDYFFEETLSFLKIPDKQILESKIPVFLNSTMSFCNQHSVYIQKAENKKNLSAELWLELLFKHEITHYLTAKEWGNPVSIFFEGLAVFFSDMTIKQRELGQSYHEQSLALLKTKHFIDFKQILYSHQYLGRRNDFRCDVEAGSFIGFLMSEYSIDFIQKVYKKSNIPTPSNVKLNIDDVCISLFKRGIYDLENEWKHWLIENFKLNNAEKERFENFTNYNDTPKKRCAFCLSPKGLDASMKCLQCSCDNSPFYEFEA